LEAYQGTQSEGEKEEGDRVDAREIREESEEEELDQVQAVEASLPKRGSAHAGAVPEARTITWRELMTDSWTFRPQ
jgi:hypothetical protein